MFCMNRVSSLAFKNLQFSRLESPNCAFVEVAKGIDQITMFMTLKPDSS